MWNYFPCLKQKIDIYRKKSCKFPTEKVKINFLGGSSSDKSIYAAVCFVVAWLKAWWCIKPICTVGLERWDFVLSMLWLYLFWYFTSPPGDNVVEAWSDTLWKVYSVHTYPCAYQIHKECPTCVLCVLFSVSCTTYILFIIVPSMNS